MSMGGLEPPRITPHAPQTCTSTIPPHRHGANIQISVFCYVVDVPDVDSRSTLSENDTQSFSCGRVPHRHGANIQISVFCYAVDVPDVDSRSTLSENNIQLFSCGRVPHRQMS